MSDTERRALALRLFGSGKPGEPGPLDPGWVVERLAGSRQTLSRWRKVGIPPDRIEEVLEAVAEILPGTEKEPPEPAWVGRLEARLIELRRNQDVVARAATQRAVEALAPDELVRAADLLNVWLEALQRQPAEDPHATHDSPARADEVQPGQ